MQLALQVSTSEYKFALAFAPSTVSENIQPRRPTTNGRIAFSQGLFEIGQSPADTLKIDISFVRDMLTDHHDYTIVNTIIGMARNLGVKAIAEGVEESAQAEALLALGCEEAQGYYFGHPEPAHVFAKKWLVARLK